MAEGVCGMVGEAVAIVGKGRGARHDAVCQVPPNWSLRFVISAGSTRTWHGITPRGLSRA
jgi:hypothetical protein